MLDFGWSEFFLIIILGLILIGPKDIPEIVYQLGRLVRRLQYMKFALSKQFDSFMEQNDLQELRRGGALGDLKGDVRAALTPSANLQAQKQAPTPDDGLEADEDAAYHEQIEALPPPAVLPGQTDLFGEAMPEKHRGKK